MVWRNARLCVGVHVNMLGVYVRLCLGTRVHGLCGCARVVCSFCLFVCLHNVLSLLCNSGLTHVHDVCMCVCQTEQAA